MDSEQPVRTHRDLLMLLLSAFFIYLCNNVLMMVTPLLVVDMGGSEITAGLQGTIFIIAAILFRFILGPLADAYGKRLAMLVGSSFFLLTAVLLLFAVEVWQVIVLRVIQAVGLASFFPAASGTAATLGGHNRKGTFIGILRVVASLSLMMGPAAAFYLVQDFGYSAFLISVAFCSGLGMLAAFFISPGNDRIGKGFFRDDKGGLLPGLNVLPLLKKSQLIVNTTFVVALCYGIFMSFAVLFVDSQTNIKNAGLFFTLFSVGGILANGFFGWLSDRFGRRQLVICGVVCLGTGSTVFAILPNVPILFYPAGIFLGAGYYGSIAVLMAWMTEKMLPEECTAGLSLQQNALDLGIAAGSGLFGLLLVLVPNYPLLYSILGLFYLGYALVLMGVALRHKIQQAC